MRCESANRYFGWISRGSITLFVALLLPMATRSAPLPSGNPRADALVLDDASSDKSSPKQPADYPEIERIDPEIGATGVDPGSDAITVLFDRAMQKGMSWTGAGPFFPGSDKTTSPYWENDRTCVLPVKLEKGRFYRVGINSTSSRNFRSADRVAVPPCVLCFTTAGATRTVERRIRVPEIVKLIPNNRVRGVDPTVKSLQVTFDMQMGGSFSWTGGGSTFPPIPKSKGPEWSRDGRTCILPVALKPNSSYQLGLNSLSYNNFQSKWGVPLKPVRYQFTTGASDSQ